MQRLIVTTLIVLLPSFRFMLSIRYLSVKKWYSPDKRLSYQLLYPMCHWNQLLVYISEFCSWA